MTEGVGQAIGTPCSLNVWYVRLHVITGERDKVRFEEVTIVTDADSISAVASAVRIARPGLDPFEVVGADYMGKADVVHF